MFYDYTHHSAMNSFWEIMITELLVSRSIYETLSHNQGRQLIVSHFVDEGIDASPLTPPPKL